MTNKDNIPKSDKSRVVKGKIKSAKPLVSKADTKKKPVGATSRWATSRDDQAQILATMRKTETPVTFDAPKD